MLAFLFIACFLNLFVKADYQSYLVLSDSTRPFVAPVLSVGNSGLKGYLPLVGSILFEVDQSSSTHAGGGAGAGAGKANFVDITISKMIDANSPTLFAASAKGAHISGMTIISYSGRNGGALVPFFSIKLTEVIITSIKLDLAAGTETITLNYAQITETFSPGTSSAVSAGWNVATNVVA